MPSIYDAEGEGICFSIGTGDYGISVAIGAVESGRYQGINLQIGGGLGLSPVSISYMETETRVGGEPDVEGIDPASVKNTLLNEKAKVDQQINQLCNSNKQLRLEYHKKETSSERKAQILNQLTSNNSELKELFPLTEGLQIAIDAIDKID